MFVFLSHASKYLAIEIGSKIRNIDTKRSKNHESCRYSKIHVKLMKLEYVIVTFFSKEIVIYCENIWSRLALSNPNIHCHT